VTIRPVNSNARRIMIAAPWKKKWTLTQRPIRRQGCRLATARGPAYITG
jgi:hypothetical protein